MTPQEAEALAAKVFAAIDSTDPYPGDSLAADRERVASYLGVFRVSWERMAAGRDLAAWHYVNTEACHGLRRTGRLYGVTE